MSQEPKEIDLLKCKPGTVLQITTNEATVYLTITDHVANVGDELVSGVSFSTNSGSLPNQRSAPCNVRINSVLRRHQPLCYGLSPSGELVSAGRVDTVTQHFGNTKQAVKLLG